MKRAVRFCLALLVMIAMVSSALAEIKIENASPALIQQVQVHGRDNLSGEKVANYGDSAVSFHLLKDALVNVYSAENFIGGYGGAIEKVWLTPLEGKAFSAGDIVLKWENCPFINLDWEEGGMMVWSGNPDFTCVCGPIYLEAFELPADEAPEGSTESKPEEVVKPTKGVWYPDNTVCAFGLCLRDEYPGLTDKWYNVVPVDVSRDGTTVIPLVASNLFVIGQAEVVVQGDQVTVNYALANGEGYVNDETVKWFASMDEITADWLKQPQSDLAFGQAVSRTTDLKGQNVALLFICNHVTYRQPYTNTGIELPRLWPNQSLWEAYRASLRDLIVTLPQ